MSNASTDDTRSEPAFPVVSAAGDAALVVKLGDRMDRELSQRVLALGRRVMAERGLGSIEAVPAFAALTVHFDPDQVDLRALAERLSVLANEASESHATEPAAPSRLWLVPVCYEPPLAADLEDIAARTGLAAAEVIARHAAIDYHVYMLGFLPGFPYMGDIDQALRLPRRATPRVAVAAGSVAIAGAMTAIYPLESPGGWHIIGRTPVKLFDAASTPPALLAPGDRVRFRPATLGEFERLAAMAAAGLPIVEPALASGGAAA